MGETTIQIREIIKDLRASWYFRVWAALWVFCAVFSFAVLILDGKHATANKEHPPLEIRIENASEIRFPKFHFLAYDNVKIESLSCLRNSVRVNITSCDPKYGPFDICRQVEGESFIAYNNKSLPEGNVMIFCELDTVGNQSMIAFDIVGSGSFGPNSFTSIWLHPTMDAMILLEKREIIMDEGAPKHTQWSRDLVYRSDMFTNGVYRMNIVIGSFKIEHIKPKVIYNGWMAVGDVGGFAFFLLILHTAVMLVVGVFFENHSHFLKGSRNEQEMNKPLLGSQQ